MAPGSAASLEILNQSADLFYRREIARSYQIKPDNVNLITTDEFDSGASRFLFGFTDETPPTGFTPSFVKLAKEERYKRQLEREVKSMELAHDLGIHTIDIHNGYFETPLGFGIIRLRRLDAGDGYFLANDELIAAADNDLHFGQRAAKLIASSVGKIIPPERKSDFLIRGQKRIDSENTFWEVWDQENSIVLDSKHNGYRNKLIPSQNLQNILANTKEDLHPLVKYGVSENEYFVHNDTSPSNCFFTNGNSQGLSDILLDFEQAAATHNLVLATLIDLGDFYNRSWANPAMQQEYMSFLMSELTQYSPEERYKIIRGAAVFGTMNASQYYMDENNNRHNKAVGLLQNLESNLSAFDDFYNKTK